MPTKLLTELEAAKYLGLRKKDFLALIQERTPAYFQGPNGAKMFTTPDLDAWVELGKVSAAGRVKAPQQPEAGEPVSAAPRTALADPAAERERLRRLQVPGGDQQRPIPEDMPYVRPVSQDAPNPYRGMSPREIAGCGLPGEGE